MNISKIREYFKREPHVLFAILFGSQATGKTTKMSDIDVAVYLHNVEHKRFFDMRLKFMSNCPGKGEKDVVILNDSPPLLAYEIVSRGKPILLKDKKAFISFKAKAFCRYLDTKRLRSVQYSALVRRIKEGRIGHFEGNNSISVAKVRELSGKIARIGQAH